MKYEISALRTFLKIIPNLFISNGFVRNVKQLYPEYGLQYPLKEGVGSLYIIIFPFSMFEDTIEYWEIDEIFIKLAFRCKLLLIILSSPITAPLNYLRLMAGDYIQNCYSFVPVFHLFHLVIWRYHYLLFVELFYIIRLINGIDR